MPQSINRVLKSAFGIPVLVGVLFALGLSSPGIAGEINRVFGVLKSDSLNVREGPGTRFRDIGDISNGATVDVRGYAANGKWAIIKWRGQQAYISAKFLKPLGVDANGQKLGTWKPRGRYVVGNIESGDPGLNLRSGSSASSDKLATLRSGTRVRVLRRGSRSGWVYIVTENGQRGHVRDTFLVRSSGSGNSSSSTSNSNGSNTENSVLSGSAQAPNCALPGVFTVINVASSDRLNMRDAANAGGNIIGSFGPSEPVAVVNWGNSGWARVSSGEATGYVRNSFLQCGGHTTNQAGFPTNLLCYGTEPFWRADINNNGTMTYKGVDQPTSPPATFQSTNPNSLTGNYPYTFAAVPFSGTMSRSICNDGMSDVTNIWGIQLNVPNGSGGFTALNGCCRMK